MDENHYVTDARLAKLEEGLHEERSRITDLQHVSHQVMDIYGDNPKPYWVFRFEDIYISGFTVAN